MALHCTSRTVLEKERKLITIYPIIPHVLYRAWYLGYSVIFRGVECHFLISRTYRQCWHISYKKSVSFFKCLTVRTVSESLSHQFTFFLHSAHPSIIERHSCWLPNNGSYEVLGNENKMFDTCHEIFKLMWRLKCEHFIHVAFI